MRPESPDSVVGVSKTTALIIGGIGYIVVVAYEQLISVTSFFIFSTLRAFIDGTILFTITFLLS